MQYHEARPLIRSGDVLAWTHRGWASWYDLQVQAVRLFTRSEYSHVAIAWAEGGRVWVIESVTPKIRIVPLSNLIGKDGVYWLPTRKPSNAAEVEFSLSRVGTGEYSKWQAMLAFIKKLRLGRDNFWECAEFVIAARRFSGVNLGPVATPSAVVRQCQEVHGSSCTLILP